MTIFFPDLSHWKPGVPLNGAAALTTKATQGTDSIDPTYETYRSKALALGIPFAGFHYVTTDDPAAQARHAYSVIGPDIPAMWDVEKGSGTIAHLLAVHDAYIALGGRATLGYIPHWYWQSLGSPSLAGVKARGLALISSAYTAYSDNGPGWAGYGGMTPAIWQYTDAHNLNGHSVDYNAFKGTAAELAALIQGDEVTKDDIAAIVAALKPVIADQVEAKLTDPATVKAFAVQFVAADVQRAVAPPFPVNDDYAGNPAAKPPVAGNTENQIGYTLNDTQKRVRAICDHLGLPAHD